MPLSDFDYRQWEAERRENLSIAGFFGIGQPYIFPETGEKIHTPMSMMRQRIADRLREKYDGHTIYLSEELDFFDYRESEQPVYLGSTSWSRPTTKEKWIGYGNAKDIGIEIPVTSPELARTYLMLKYPDPRHIRAEQYRVCVKEKVLPPAYVRPGWLHDGASYLDLKSAYWQITRALGWDVDYMPGQWLTRGQSMVDFPYRFESLARNSLVSCGIASNVTLWTGKELKLVPVGSSLANRVLWRAVCDVLNGVAWDAMQAGAQYINVDGYIVDGAHTESVIKAMEAWGFKFAVKHFGDSGVIRGIGSYRVGSYMSIPYQKSVGENRMERLYNPSPVRGLDWLRDRFRSYVELANQEWLFLSGVEGYDD